MIIPFGKYKGTDIEDVPSSYLKWLSENCEDDEVREEAEKEYKFRSTYKCHKE